MNGPLKKRIPKYDTKVFMGRVVVIGSTGKKGIIYEHPTYYQHEINQFQVGDKVAVKMTNRKQKRTDAQNRYMHLYFSLIALSSGHSGEEIKAWAKGEFLTTGIREIFGKKTRVVKDTSKLKLLEMMEFLEQVAERTGVPLPDATPFNMPLSQSEWEELKQEQKYKYRQFKPNLSTVL